MQPEHVPRLDDPASGPGCHSAAALATVSGGAFTRLEVIQSYTDPMKRFPSDPDRTSSRLVLVEQREFTAADFEGAGLH